MARYVALLRGINLGARNKVAMPRLREVLAEAGFDDVATYVQSGNVLVSTAGSAASVAERVRIVVREAFDIDVPVVVRTRAQLQRVVELDPIAGAADDPKRYQVTFLDAKVPTSAWADVDPDAWGESTYVATPTELFTYTPAGIQSDRMLRALATAPVDTTGTARNWRTVTALLAMLDGDA